MYDQDGVDEEGNVIWKPYWKDKTSKYCLYVMVKFDRMKQQKGKTYYVF